MPTQPELLTSEEQAMVAAVNDLLPHIAAVAAASPDLGGRMTAESFRHTIEAQLESYVANVTMNRATAST